MNAWQIARLSRDIVLEGDNAGEIRQHSMPGLELDESEAEIFWQYSEKLNQLGVELANPNLIEALNSNPTNIESGILAFIQYEARYRFKDRYHPTDFLAKSIREGWKPNE
jgi:hypothetical protein